MLGATADTDNVGGFAFNMILSKKRADAVVAALIKDWAPSRDFAVLVCVNQGGPRRPSR